MKVGIIAAVAVVVAALRISSRRRRRATDRSSVPSLSGRFTGSITLVASREIRERVRGRTFRVGTLLILVVVAAAIVIPTLGGTKSRAERLGVIGSLSASERSVVVSSGASIRASVHLVREKDSKAADAALRSGRVGLVIVNGSELVVDKSIASTDSSTTAQLVRSISQGLGALEAVAAADLSAAQASRLAHARALPVASLERGPAKGSTRGTSIVGLILIFVMLSQYDTWILIGVMEEKSSRVVEVLLAAVRPVQLLSGKVLGIGLVAFAQAGLIVMFALVLAKAVGSDLLSGTAPVELASTFAWLVLGYAFYSWVYAAAGSMAERQDQIQTLAFPLSVPMIFGYVMGITAAASGSPSTFFDVLAYLPPTAPFAMPVLVGLGTVTWWEVGASIVISIVCTFGVAKLAASIYRRAILRTGRRVRLREVLSRAAR